MSSIELPARYKILSELGSGGMGSVYKAHDSRLDKSVAIKVISKDSISSEPSIVQRFQQEAKLAANLKHENFITIFDFGISDNGLPYLVMEYIEGKTLKNKLEESSLHSLDVLEIFKQIASAMAHAHSNDVIHRDLKTENLILTNSEDDSLSVKIIDFGIAKSVGEDIGSKGLTKTNVILGSPLFMSPEQAHNKTVDSRTDIYSLGCIIYACLTGEPPFRGDTVLDTIDMHINADAIPVNKRMVGNNCPLELESLVMSCLEKDPNRRPQSMAELVELLNDLSESDEEESVYVEASEEEAYEATRKTGNSVLPVVIGCVVVAIIFGCFAFLGINGEDAKSSKVPSLASHGRFEHNEYPPESQQSINFNFIDGNEETGDIVDEVIDYKKRCELGDAVLIAGLTENPDKQEVLIDENLTDFGLEALKNVSHVRTLKLQNCIELTGDKLVECIAHLPITDLNIAGTNITNKNLQAIAKMQSIRYLRLDNCREITDDGLVYLVKLKNLKELRLKKTKITDSGASYIARMKNLRLLFLQNTGVTDHGVDKLAPLENLEYLSLLGTGINGQCFSTLIALPKLQKLHLSYTNITDQSLKVLEEKKDWLQIELDYCDKLSKDGLLQLKKALPNSEVSAVRA